MTSPPISPAARGVQPAAAGGPAPSPPGGAGGGPAQPTPAPGRPSVTRAAGFHITSRDGVTALVSDQRDHVLDSGQLAELIAALQAAQERAR